MPKKQPLKNKIALVAPIACGCAWQLEIGLLYFGLMAHLRIQLTVLLLAWFACTRPVFALDDLSTLLSRFQFEHDRTAKEAILENITSGHPEAGEGLTKIARETGDSDTKWLAIRGIGRVKFRDAAPFLRESLNSQSAYVRANAARARGEIRDSSAATDLIRVLKTEEDSGVIEQTALALQMLSAHEALPALKAKMSNPSPQTRLWILGAVQTLGSRADVPFFADFLFDSDETVASFAAGAIERFTGEDFGLPKSVSGPCGLGEEGVQNAQRWWNNHRQDWKH